LGSDHLRIEFAFDEAPDRVMIRITIPAIDNRFSHLHRFKKESYKKAQRIHGDGASAPIIKTSRDPTIDWPQVPRLPNRSSPTNHCQFSPTKARAQSRRARKDSAANSSFPPFVIFASSC
jgi:hypothetical protein